VQAIILNASRFKLVSWVFCACSLISPDSKNFTCRLIRFSIMSLCRGKKRISLKFSKMPLSEMDVKNNVMF
jgi:hypothetical protein